MIFAVGPLIALPPTIGETATQGDRAPLQQGPGSHPIASIGATLR